MPITNSARKLTGTAAALLALGAVVSPAHASPPLLTKLVRCGAETCLQVSGHRPHAGVAVRIAGRDVAVEGGRGWHVTVPVATARGWISGPGGSASMLSVALVDEAGVTADEREVALPPGALGRRVELANLMVSAR